MKFKTAPCKGCGKPMVWAVSKDGPLIPLDPRAPIFRVYEDPRNNVIRCHRDTPMGDGDLIGVPDTVAMVSHFSTCPQAAQFSGSKKKGQP